MIITKEDFFEMGFAAEEKDTELLERCIKRAEFVLNGLTGGRACAISIMGGAAADYVKQAAAFQTNAILREELAIAANKAEASRSEGESSSAKSEERVSIGDFSYSSGESESRSQRSSERSSDEYGDHIKPLDSDKTVARLLRAAGCFYSGTEVFE